MSLLFAAQMMFVPCSGDIMFFLLVYEVYVRAQVRNAQQPRGKTYINSVLSSSWDTMPMTLVMVTDRVAGNFDEVIK